MTPATPLRLIDMCRLYRPGVTPGDAAHSVGCGVIAHRPHVHMRPDTADVGSRVVAQSGWRASVGAFFPASSQPRRWVRRQRLVLDPRVPVAVPAGNRVVPVDAGPR